MIVLLTIESLVPLAKAANETQSEEEPSKSEVPLFWLPFLYMHANRKQP